MLLSIVMMVKDEEKYLDRTLKSLQMIMNKINSELIILDTGSKDSTVDIAKKYTDKVYYKEWENDFGEMRNKSISYANGDWILILDADEELTDCDMLFEFFNTDICNKYNCASIELKSFVSEDKDIYSKSSIIRLFKVYDGFRYEGAIHEQPIYKEPIYKDIAKFNHYGYIYSNEEVKQNKIKRNESILLKELKQKPMDPYINYQLAQNYKCKGDIEEALSWMEKAYEIYNKLNMRFIPVECGLAKIYFEVGKYEKCERLCKKYIKSDRNNIDIYCYLALSQKALRKYKESLESYDKYIYLVENYKLSTQAKDVFSVGDTITFKESARFDRISIYYELEEYEKVLGKYKELDLKRFRQAQFIINMSAYKLNKLDEIIKVYHKLGESIVDKNIFKMNLEKFILSIKETDRIKVYEMLRQIQGNYGILNYVRSGGKINIKNARKILNNENANYYGDLVYYLFKDNYDLMEVLQDIENTKLYNYITYLVSFRKDCIIDLYNYLNNRKNTMSLMNLNIYSILAKSLLINGNLKDEKYRNLFNMYVSYTYNYIKKTYNPKFSDDELIKIVNTEEYGFILEFIIIDKLKYRDKLDYIRRLKELLVKNQVYKTGIELYVKDFEKNINLSYELKSLQNEYKSLIYKDLENQCLTEASKKIDEYESIFKEESESLNLKGMVELLNGNFEESDKVFKKSYILNINNYDTIFNIACIKETMGEYKEAIDFLDYIICNCEDAEILKDANEKQESILMKCNI